MANSSRPRTEPELQVAFSEQRQFIRSSSMGYDAGLDGEAKRLAASVYVLCKDGPGKIASILGQAGLKNQLKFLSTTIPFDQFIFPKSYLAGVYWDLDQKRILPHCVFNAIPPWSKRLSFEEWWEEPIYHDHKDIGEPVGAALTRRELVIQLRTREGGAHLGATLPLGAYDNLAYQNGLGITAEAESGWAPLSNPHLASMRQIAWEMEVSLSSVPGGPPLPRLGPWPERKIDTPDQFRQERENAPNMPVGPGGRIPLRPVWLRITRRET